MNRKTPQEEIKDFLIGMLGLVVILPGAASLGIGMAYHVPLMTALGVLFLIGPLFILIKVFGKTDEST